MPERYTQSVNNGETHFTNSPTLDVEYSRMTANPRHLTTFNGGDIVPIYCREVLPGETIDMSLDFVIRQTTLLRPVFGELYADIYAFFVPNRVVNESWVNVMGENSGGAGIAPDVSLAPLVPNVSGGTSVPVGSVADYYGFPTQKSIPWSLLSQCHDLKFRGYLSIYNEFFRDQNYEAPIPFSKLNIYEGFFQNTQDTITIDGSTDGPVLYRPGHSVLMDTSGSFATGAVNKALYGEGSPLSSDVNPGWNISGRQVVWSALDPPLKANKLHDFYTSILPYPQKGLSLSILFPSEAKVFPLTAGSGPLNSLNGVLNFGGSFSLSAGERTSLNLSGYSGGSDNLGYTVFADSSPSEGAAQNNISSTNLQVEIPAGSLGTLDISNLRTVIATQQIFEVFSRAGSRYRETTEAFFGISADDPYRDIPEFLGHVRRTLNNYQVAQTSQSTSGNTPQGNLAAFSYTSTGGQLFQKTFLEHGYVHIMCVVRQRNVYSTMLWQDNFRRSMLDFYFPPLANISEQPVRRSRLNPFATDNQDDTDVLGYQEAWAEYRYEPDNVTGKFRQGIKGGSLGDWAYLDESYDDLEVIDASFIQSNAQAVIDPTLAIKSTTEPQFLAEFSFKVDKTLPMPVYSVPGLDIF